MSRRVVVLGAAGFLGRHVTLAARTQGHRVKAVTRRPRSGRLDADLTFCDAADRAGLLRAACGADCVINAVQADPDTIVQVASNLRGLLHSDAVGQVLHVSSLSIYGQQSGVMHEGIVPVPAWGDRQARGILQAETLMSPDDGYRARVVVIRPAWIYGPGAPVWIDGMSRLLLARRLGWLGRLGEGTCRLVHVQDLALAMTRAIGHDLSGIYNIAAPDALNWNDYFFRMASLIGALPLRRIGAASLAAEIWLTGARHMLAVRTGSAKPDRVTMAMARAFRSQVRIVSVRAPLLEAGAFRSLRDGSVEAAEAFLRHGTQHATARPGAALMPSPAAS